MTDLTAPTATDPDAPAEGETPAEGEQPTGEEYLDGGASDAEDQRNGEEPAAPAAPAEDVEKTLRKLGTSAGTWRNRVSELLGEDAQLLVPCELCEPDIPGFHWPADVMQPTSDLQARLLEVLKRPIVPAYRPAADAARCGECDGWGNVDTGSRKAGETEKLCGSCKGHGYVPPPSGPTLGQVAVEALAGAQTGEEPAAPAEDLDPFGSPRYLEDGQENPNYGKMPQYKHPSLP